MRNLIGSKRYPPVRCVLLAMRLTRIFRTRRESKIAAQYLLAESYLVPSGCIISLVIAAIRGPSRVALLEVNPDIRRPCILLEPLLVAGHTQKDLPQGESSDLTTDNPPYPIPRILSSVDACGCSSSLLTCLSFYLSLSLSSYQPGYPFDHPLPSQYTPSFSDSLVPHQPSTYSPLYLPTHHHHHQPTSPRPARPPQNSPSRL